MKKTKSKNPGLIIMAPGRITFELDLRGKPVPRKGSTFRAMDGDWKVYRVTKYRRPKIDAWGTVTTHAVEAESSAGNLPAASSG